MGKSINKICKGTHPGEGQDKEEKKKYLMFREKKRYIEKSK